MVSTSGEDVCILGPRKLTNRLLCDHLNSFEGLSCGVDRPLGEAAVALVDFDEDGRYLGVPSGPDHPRVWALFNVPQGRGIEKGAFAAGYRGFFYREDESDAFAKGLTALTQGEFWIPRRVLAECVGPANTGGRGARRPQLTPREREIITLLAQGLPNEAIGQSLNISSNTVKTHAYRIFRKIGVANRLQAARWASANVAPGN